MRPSVQAAALSATTLANLCASLSLLACFFLPHSVGCDNQSRRPLQIAVEQWHSGTDLISLLALWPYLFGLLTAIAMVTLVLLRPPWWQRELMLVPVTVGVLLVAGWTVLLFSGADGSRMAMTIAVVVFPVVTLVTARMYWLLRSDDMIAAASWGQGLLAVLAAFSLRWFWFPPMQQMLWGGVLSIVSVLAMMFASWTWKARGQHDLVDRRAAALPLQVSLLQMIVAIALTAIALTYWRGLGA